MTRVSSARNTDDLDVLSRGIVGTRGEAPTVASPLLKQVFDLRTGACVADETVRVVVHDVRVRDAMVEVRLRRRR